MTFYLFAKKIRKLTFSLKSDASDIHPLEVSEDQTVSPKAPKLFCLSIFENMKS